MAAAGHLYRAAKTTKAQHSRCARAGRRNFMLCRHAAQREAIWRTSQALADKRFLQRFYSARSKRKEAPHSTSAGLKHGYYLWLLRNEKRKRAIKYATTAQSSTATAALKQSAMIFRIKILPNGQTTPRVRSNASDYERYSKRRNEAERGCWTIVIKGCRWSQAIRENCNFTLPRIDQRDGTLTTERISAHFRHKNDWLALLQQGPQRSKHVSGNWYVSTCCNNRNPISFPAHNLQVCKHNSMSLHHKKLIVGNMQI